MKRVIVNIDRLVLKGFRFEDRHAMGEGLREHLAQWLSEPGMAERLGATGSAPRLRLGNIQVAGEMRGQAIGRAMGRAIAGHWSQDGRVARPSATDSAPGQGAST